jgi:hypothetical protein
MLVELVVILLGALLIRVGVSTRLLWNRRSPVWVALGAFLVYWGVRAWIRPRAVGLGGRWEARLRGSSLALLGVLMLGVVWVPFPWVAPLLVTAGSILILRGALNLVIVARLPDGQARAP